MTRGSIRIKGFRGLRVLVYASLLGAGCTVKCRDNKVTYIGLGDPQCLNPKTDTAKVAKCKRDGKCKEKGLNKREVCELACECERVQFK